MSGERTELERRALDRLEPLLALEPAAREAALQELAAGDPGLAAELAALLAAAPATTFAFAGAVGRAADALSAEREVAERPRHLGDYRVLELLGRGGMGEVYRGERADGQFQQHVAIKLLKRGMDSEEILHRFLRERQILAQLSHPGVARLLDGGLAPDGRPYFVLEEVHGRPITEYAEHAALPLRNRLALFLDVCDAVESAHQRLIVHRDLKPSNILVTDDGPEGGRVKLLDFGIAKVLGETGEPELTRTQLRILTPAYAAPEQILGDAATTATDVYSLGVVLYELVTGTRPHQRVATSPSGLLAELQRETIEKPSAVTTVDPRFRKELVGDLDTILLTALEREPARRYKTVAALAQDLRWYLEGRPIAARPATWRYSTGKFLHRHRVGVASASLALLALLAGLAASLWQADRARRAAVRAERTQAFLVSLFRSSDPWEGGTEKLTVGEMLDAASPKLERELAGEPEVRAALEDALAQIYQRLGRLEQAGELASRSVLERQRRFGADSPEAGWSLVTRAEVEFTRGDPERALETLAVATPNLGKPEQLGPEELLRLHEVRGAALEQAGRLEELLAETETMLALLKRRFGEDYPELGRLYAAVGSVYANGARYPEAEVALRHALELREKVLPPDHPWPTVVRVELAEVLDSLARYPESLAMFEQALASQRRTLGPNQPELAQTLTKYGFSLSTRGRLADSDAAYREALAIFESLGHYDAGAVLRYLGFNMMSEHRWQEGADYFFRADERIEKQFAEDHPMRLATASTAGFGLLRLGRIDEAVAQLRRVAAGFERTEGPTSNHLRPVIGYLGEALRLQGDIEAALTDHRRQRSIAALVSEGKDNVNVAQADFQIALDLLSRRPPDSAEARRLLDHACAYVREQVPEHVRVGECLLIDALVALREGDLARADRAATEGVAWVRQRFPADGPFVADAEDVLDRVRRRFTGGRIPPWGPADGMARRRSRG